MRLCNTIAFNAVSAITQNTIIINVVKCLVKVNVIIFFVYDFLHYFTLNHIMYFLGVALTVFKFIHYSYIITVLVFFLIYYYYYYFYYSFYAMKYFSEDFSIYIMRFI